MIYLTKTSKKRGKQRMRGGDKEIDELAALEEGRATMVLPDINNYSDLKILLNGVLVNFERDVESNKIVPNSSMEAARIVSGIIVMYRREKNKDIQQWSMDYLNENVEEPPSSKGGTRRRRRAKSSKKRRGKRSRRA